MLTLTILRIVALLLNVLWWIIIVQVVLSWLIMFNVINTSSPAVRQLLSALDQLTEPIYRPIRRVLPDFGGIDFSPFVVLIVIKILQQIILPQIAIASGAIV